MVRSFQVRSFQSVVRSFHNIVSSFQSCCLKKIWSFWYGNHGAALIIRFRFPTCHAFITWFELSRVKLSRNVLKGNKNYLELAGVFLHYSKCETEIQGKSTLVRVSARFELARVRVIGVNRILYRNFISILSSFLTYIKLKFHRQRCMNS